MQIETAARQEVFEWTTAAEVQRRFMQHSLEQALPTPNYSARCRQMCQVGGDCYDFLRLPDGRFGLAIADASGKGLAAALMISNVQSSLRTAALFSGSDLAGAVAAVNQQLHASSLPERYATLFYGVFDSARRTLQSVNAGHNPPMVLRRDGSADWLETGGAPLGMFPNCPYTESTVQLHAGDVVVAYTDGVIDAFSPAGESWGLEGLQHTVAKNIDRSADEIVDAIFEAMDNFTRGRQADDATVIVLKVQ